jgi:2-polyprenyl-3-methyl-5-hydroxy-6-metoxy-1,4-benzoquinol methylase
MERTMGKYSEVLNQLGYYEAQPKPTLEELNQHYKEKYYQDAQGSYAAEYLPEELRSFQNIAKISLETSTRLKIDTSLLDLGCGEGFFTKSFHSFGWKVSCCDFSEFGIAKHNGDMLPFFSAGELSELIEKYKGENNTYGLLNRVCPKVS